MSQHFWATWQLNIASILLALGPSDWSPGNQASFVIVALWTVVFIIIIFKNPLTVHQISPAFSRTPVLSSKGSTLPRLQIVLTFGGFFKNFFHKIIYIKTSHVR